MNKKQRIRDIAMGMEGTFSKRDMQLMMLDISGVMIQQELSDMVDEGLLVKDGTTKGTHYKKI